MTVIHPKLRPFEDLVEMLSPRAKASAQFRRAPRRKSGGTVRPGAETPLWSRLVEQAQPFLAQRGEKAQLARLLGVHRQAINEYFVSRTRMPDAERTLLLNEWLHIRTTGKKPTW